MPVAPMGTTVANTGSNHGPTLVQDARRHHVLTTSLQGQSR